MEQVAISNPSFVLIVLAPGCGTEVKRRGERSGRSASNGRIAGDLGGNSIYVVVTEVTLTLERYVRQACDQLVIQRRGVHGFRATAACQFVDVKRALGYTEAEARRELAMWLGHNPHRTEVTYAYVPRGEHDSAKH